MVNRAVLEVKLDLFQNSNSCLMISQILFNKVCKCGNTQKLFLLFRSPDSVMLALNSTAPDLIDRTSEWNDLWRRKTKDPSRPTFKTPRVKAEIRDKTGGKNFKTDPGKKTNTSFIVQRRDCRSYGQESQRTEKEN